MVCLKNTGKWSALDEVVILINWSKREDFEQESDWLWNGSVGI